MKGASTAVVVFASALLSITGLASAEVLDQSLRSSNDVVHQASEQPGTLVAAETEKKTDPAPSGDVQERAIPRTGLGTVPVLPKRNTVSTLTKAECTGLGCKAVTDNTCPDVGALRERCSCKAGTKGLCIDEVK
jgi:hypothetical protein